MLLKRIERFGCNGWGGVNRRAASALDAITTSFQRVMGDDFSAGKVDERTSFVLSVTDSSLASAVGTECLASVRFRRGDGSLLCYMGYVPHNKALSTIYDFTVWVPVESCFGEGGDRGKGHGFVQRFEDENSLVADRAESLGLVNSRVLSGNDRSLVEMRFMVGSFTWTAVPPVSNTIALSDQDCVRLAELLFMINLSVRELAD